jgi:3D-(3,5/4)-trihydroxycyclohexane-1,2-dione acylhydrolase (decyclizing)
LFSGAKLLSLNVQRFDAGKWSGAMLVADAQLGLNQLSAGLAGWHADAAWTARSVETAARWNARVTELTTNVPKDVLPYDAEVIGAVRDSHADSAARDIVVCAAGTLPAELHKLWRASRPGGYHVEYGYSCMGYEIAGALGVKMAQPGAEVIVIVGDGSYMMLNAELATSVLLGQKIIVVVLDNRGYGCIERLQVNTGNASFNNMLDDCVPEGGARSTIDFAMNARSMGAHAVHVASVAELKTAMVAARAAPTTQVIVIDTTHERTTAEGGCWWQVGVPEVSERPEVLAAHARWHEAQAKQRL